ncbi:MAG: hypothetical protein NTZ95_03945 [Candidatus Omnitrophica bacterium]|nr:hypothetical protein [Candidatus Omnitrophota bacterium]
MKRLSLGCVVIALFLAGCATVQLTPDQKRTIEARELEGVYEDAFKATLQVLQDNGYVIKSSDHASGVIQGETGVKMGWFGRMDNTEITVTLEQFGANTVKERMTVVGKVKVSSQYGTHEDSKNIDDPELFQKLYNEIQKEMFIRKNLNK